MTTPQSPSAGTARHVLDSVFTGKAYRWQEPAHPFAWLSRLFQAVRVWFFYLADHHPTLFNIICLALTTILVAIVVHAVSIFVGTIRATSGRSEEASAALLRRDRAWYRNEAERFAREGRYVESMQAEFLALIFAMDSSRIVRFHPSKTPAEYLAESALTPGARAEFRELVSSLYGYAFARWPCDAEQLADWRSRASPERYAPTH